MVNMSKLCSLQVLGLASCYLSVDVTNLFESLPHCYKNELQELYLSRNNISGALPDGMGHLTSMTILNLMHNNISGPLPPFIGNFTSLVILYISYNQLTDQVPHEIGMLSNLTQLYLDHNDFEGAITEEHFASL